MFNTYLTTLLPELDATSIDELAAVISAGSVDGLSVAEIAANIRHSPAFENLRAELIARTEALRAANYAGRQAMIDFGAKKVEWYTAQDELVCPTCGDLDGEVVAIEDAFVGVGDAIPGLNPNVPSGHAKVNVEYPPVHPRCRCTLLPTESDFSL